MELTLLWLVPALVAAAATAVGRYEEQRGLTWLNVPLRALWSLMVVAVLVTAFVVREDGVTWGQFLFGIAVGVIGLALLPVFVFYVLGRLVHRTWLLIVLWFLATCVLGTYIWLVGLLFLLGVACEPGCLS